MQHHLGKVSVSTVQRFQPLAALVRRAAPALKRYGWPALYIVSSLLFLSSYAAFYDAATGFTRLIAHGSEFHERTSPRFKSTNLFIEPESWGYDGQFYAQLAIDPLLRDPALSTALDNPPFRGRRILFSWTAWLFGAGQDTWVIHAFSVQNAIFWLVSAWLLTHWFPPTSFFNFARWFACLFSAGMLISAKLSLLDGPSMAVLLLTARLAEGNRPWSAGVAFAASILARETNVFFASVLPRLRPWRWAQIGRFALVAALACLPYALWLVYVTYRFGAADAQGSGGLAAPFAGIATKLTSLIADAQNPSLDQRLIFWTACALIGYFVQFAAISQRPDVDDRWWRVLALFGVFSLILGPAVWEGHPGAFVRVLLPMTFAFNLRLKPGLGGWAWWALGNLGVIYGVECMKIPFLVLLF